MRNFGRKLLACLVLILLLQSCENETEDVLQPGTITELPFTSMKLEDLTEFQPLKSKKWMIGADAYSHRGRCFGYDAPIPDKFQRFFPDAKPRFLNHWHLWNICIGAQGLLRELFH